MSTQSISSAYAQYVQAVLQREAAGNSSLPNYLQVLLQNQGITGKDSVNLSLGDGNQSAATAQVLKALEQLNYTSNTDLLGHLYGQGIQHDSFFLNDGTNLAFAFNQISQNYGSVNSYINSADPAVLSYLQSLHANGEIRTGMSFDQKVTVLYNHVINNFDYVQEGEDTWAFAGETIAKGSGDCEDLTLLLQNLIYTLGLEDGIPAETLNQRLNAVVGKHSQFGDHVYLEYTDTRGITHALDASLALQGTVTDLNKLVTATEYRKNFDIYFTFNDSGTTVIKKVDSTQHSGSNLYIDPQNPAIQKELNRLFDENILSRNSSSDQLALDLLNYINSSFTYVASELVKYPWDSLADQNGSQKDLNILFANLLAGALQKTGLADIEINQRISLVFNHDNDGTENIFVSYSDGNAVTRLLDVTGQKLSHLDQISPERVWRVLEQGGIDQFARPGSIGDWPTLTEWQQAGLVIDFELPLNDLRLQKRNIFNFNSKFGLPGFIAQRDNTPDWWTNAAMRWDPKFDPKNSATAVKPIIVRSNNPFPPIDGVPLIIHMPNFENVDIGEVDRYHSGDASNSSVIYQAARAFQASAQKELVHLSDWNRYVTVTPSFVGFNEVEYEKARNRLQHHLGGYQALVAVAQNIIEAHGRVSGELNDTQSYQSMDIKSLASKEASYIMRSTIEIKQDLKRIINARNELYKSTMTKVIQARQNWINKMSFSQIILGMVGMAASFAAVIAAAFLVMVAAEAAFAACLAAVLCAPGAVAVKIGVLVAGIKTVFDMFGDLFNGPMKKVNPLAPPKYAAKIASSGLLLIPAIPIGIAANAPEAIATLGIAIPGIVGGWGLAVATMLMNAFTLTMESVTVDAQEQQAKFDKEFALNTLVEGANLNDALNQGTQINLNSMEGSTGTGFNIMRSVYGELQSSVNSPMVLPSSNGYLALNYGLYLTQKDKLTRKQNLMRVYAKLHGEIISGRSLVHQEMSGKSNQQSNQSVMAQIESELSITNDMMQRMFEVQSRFVREWNTAIKSNFLKEKQSFSFEAKLTAFRTSILFLFVPFLPGPALQMALAATIAEVKNFTTPDYNNPIASDLSLKLAASQLGDHSLIRENGWPSYPHVNGFDPYTELLIDNFVSGESDSGGFFAPASILTPPGYAVVAGDRVIEFQKKLNRSFNVAKCYLMLKKYKSSGRSAVHQEMTQISGRRDYGSGLLELYNNEKAFLEEYLRLKVDLADTYVQTNNNERADLTQFQKSLLSKIPFVGATMAYQWELNSPGSDNNIKFYQYGSPDVLWGVPNTSTEVSNLLMYQTGAKTRTPNSIRVILDTISIFEALDRVKIESVKLSALKSVRQAINESRRIVHQELTRIASASADEFSDSIVESENSTRMANFRSLQKLAGELAQLYSKYAQAKYTATQSMVKSWIELASGGGAIVILILTKTLTSTSPVWSLSPFRIFELAYTIGGLVSMVWDIAWKIKEYSDGDHWDNQVAALRRILYMIQKNQKNKGGNEAMNALEDKQNEAFLEAAMVDTSRSGDVSNSNSGFIMSAQAKFDRQTKLKKAILKLKGAQSESYNTVRGALGSAGRKRGNVANDVTDIASQTGSGAFAALTSNLEAKAQYESRKAGMLTQIIISIANFGISLPGTLANIGKIMDSGKTAQQVERYGTSKNPGSTPGKSTSGDIGAVQPDNGKNINSQSKASQDVDALRNTLQNSPLAGAAGAISVAAKVLEITVKLLVGQYGGVGAAALLAEGSESVTESEQNELNKRQKQDHDNLIEKEKNGTLTEKEKERLPGLKADQKAIENKIALFEAKTNKAAHEKVQQSLKDLQELKDLKAKPAASRSATEDHRIKDLEAKFENAKVATPGPGQSKPGKDIAEIKVEKRYTELSPEEIQKLESESTKGIQESNDAIKKNPENARLQAILEEYQRGIQPIANLIRDLLEIYLKLQDARKAQEAEKKIREAQIQAASMVAEKDGNTATENIEVAASLLNNQAAARHVVTQLQQSLIGSINEILLGFESGFQKKEMGKDGKQMLVFDVTHRRGTGLMGFATKYGYQAANAGLGQLKDMLGFGATQRSYIAEANRLLNEIQIDPNRAKTREQKAAVENKIEKLASLLKDFNSERDPNKRAMMLWKIGNMVNEIQGLLPSTGQEKKEDLQIKEISATGGRTSISMPVVRIEREKGPAEARTQALREQDNSQVLTSSPRVSVPAEPPSQKIRPATDPMQPVKIQAPGTAQEVKDVALPVGTVKPGTSTSGQISLFDLGNIIEANHKEADGLRARANSGISQRNLDEATSRNQDLVKTRDALQRTLNGLLEKDPRIDGIKKNLSELNSQIDANDKAIDRALGEQQMAGVELLDKYEAGIDRVFGFGGTIFESKAYALLPHAQRNANRGHETIQQASVLLRQDLQKLEAQPNKSDADKAQIDLLKKTLADTMLTARYLLQNPDKIFPMDQNYKPVTALDIAKATVHITQYDNLRTITTQASTFQQGVTKEGDATAINGAVEGFNKNIQWLSYVDKASQNKGGISQQQLDGFASSLNGAKSPQETFGGIRTLMDGLIKNSSNPEQMKAVDALAKGMSEGKPISQILSENPQISSQLQGLTGTTSTGQAFNGLELLHLLSALESGKGAGFGSDQINVSATLTKFGFRQEEINDISKKVAGGGALNQEIRNDLRAVFLIKITKLIQGQSRSMIPEPVINSASFTGIRFGKEFEYAKDDTKKETPIGVTRSMEDVGEAGKTNAFNLEALISRSASGPGFDLSKVQALEKAENAAINRLTANSTLADETRIASQPFDPKVKQTTVAGDSRSSIVRNCNFARSLDASMEKPESYQDAPTTNEQLYKEIRETSNRELGKMPQNNKAYEARLLTRTVMADELSGPHGDQAGVTQAGNDARAGMKEYNQRLEDSKYNLTGRSTDELNDLLFKKADERQAEMRFLHLFTGLEPGTPSETKSTGNNPPMQISYQSHTTGLDGRDGNKFKSGPIQGNGFDAVYATAAKESTARTETPGVRERALPAKVELRFDGGQSTPKGITEKEMSSMRSTRDKFTQGGTLNAYTAFKATIVNGRVIDDPKDIKAAYILAGERVFVDLLTRMAPDSNPNSAYMNDLRKATNVTEKGKGDDPYSLVKLEALIALAEKNGFQIDGDANDLISGKSISILMPGSDNALTLKINSPSSNVSRMQQTVSEKLGVTELNDNITQAINDLYSGRKSAFNPNGLTPTTGPKLGDGTYTNIYIDKDSGKIYNEDTIRRAPAGVRDNCVKISHSDFVSQRAPGLIDSQGRAVDIQTATITETTTTETVSLDKPGIKLTQGKKEGTPVTTVVQNNDPRSRPTRTN